QMVLLRDALLPFSNWAEVPLPLDGRGLRRLEGPREKFLAELLIRQIRHTAIVDYARDVLVPDNESHIEGYGFVYSGGTVLPHVTGAPSVLTSTDLLVWSPDGGAVHPDGDNVSGVVDTYTSRQTDYFEAPRTAPGLLATTTGEAALRNATARIVDSSAESGSRHAAIEVSIGGIDGDDTVARIDLGQALRGHRYAYSTAAASETAPRGATEWMADATRLDAAGAVAAQGLVWDDEGDYVLNPGQDGLVALAVLGAIYPENVVLRRASDDVRPSAVGKTGPARFEITLPE
ncbi:MAG: hypothetical protein L0K86_29110, partial [Actinomycetia bacterium]|nr:hypothetical protein [Actinomycetes bacterium]